MISDIVVSIVSLVVGAFFGLWLGEFVKRPKIVASGGGGGAVGGDGYRVATVAVTNSRAFIGIRLGRTMLFGRGLFNARDWGIWIDRRPAKITAALLERNDRPGLGLPVESDREPGKALSQAVVATDEHVRIHIFARQVDVPDRFYVYQATSETDLTPRPPQPGQREWTEGDFVLRIHSDHGQVLTVPVRVFMHMQGTLWVEVGGGRTGFTSGTQF